MGRKCHAVAALAVAFAAAAAAAVAADRRLSLGGAAVAPEEETSLFRMVANLMWNSDGNSYQHVWPVITNCLVFFFQRFFVFFSRKEHVVCLFYQSPVASLAVLRWVKFTKLECWICLVGSECQSSSALDLSWNPVWVMQIELRYILLNLR